MKALSLKQPFAELILQGRKKIELRKWNTNFRGEFLIHSSKKQDEKAMQKFKEFLPPRFKDESQMKEFGFKELPLGFIVGKAKLIGVRHYKDKEEFEKDKTKHLATSEFGNYGFILEDVTRIKPIEAKGKLNFWEFGCEF